MTENFNQMNHLVSRAPHTKRIQRSSKRGYYDHGWHFLEKHERGTYN